MSETKASQKSAFIDTLLGNFFGIVDDNFTRNKQVTEKRVKGLKPSEILSEGVWYATDFCAAAEKFGKKTLLAGLIKTGASYHGRMPPKLFAQVASSDPRLAKKMALAHFVIAKGTTPSEAIDGLKGSVCLLGCGEAQDIAVYQSLKSLIGNEKFDVLFGAGSKTPLTIGGNDKFYEKLMNRIKVEDPSSILPGDFCYFTNIQKYMTKHLFGIGRGFHVICNEVTKNGPLFLGLGLNPKGCSAQDVEQALLDEYNADPRPEHLVGDEVVSRIYETSAPYAGPGGKTLYHSKELVKQEVASQSNIKLTKEEFDKEPLRDQYVREKMKGKLHLFIDRFDPKKIALIVKTPLSQLREVFNKL